MELAEAPESTGEEWRNKASETFVESGDAIASAVTKAFATMSGIVHNDSDQEHIRQVLNTLQSDLYRSLLCQFAKIKNDCIQDLFHNFIESLNLTLGATHREMSRMKKTGQALTHTIQEPTLSQLLPLNSSYLMNDYSAITSFNSVFPIAATEEVVDNFSGFPTHNEMSSLDFGGNVNMDEHTMDLMNSGMDDTDATLNRINASYNGNMDGNAALMMSKESNNEFDGMKRTFRIEPKNWGGNKRNSPNDVFGSSGADVKKSRVTNDMELNCPVCNWCTSSVGSWLYHLRTKHSTTPVQTGYTLRCDCGHVSSSEKHSSICAIARFTVIRYKQPEKKKGLQCILCDMFPATAGAYIKHLQLHHKTTLNANGVCLKCVCGFVARSHGNLLQNHNKECDRCEFAITKLGEQ